SNTQEKNWKTIMHFLNPKNTDTVEADTEKMKKHLNKNILPSQEQLHAELDLEPFVNCPSIEENNTMLAGKTTAYYELLAYIEQIMEQEDSLKIDDLTFTQFRNDTYMQYIEASFTDGKTVEIKLFNSPDASADRYFYEHEEEKNQAEQMPDWMKFIYTQVIIPISKVIDNPLEKSANLYVNQQEAHKEKIREDNIEKVEDTARYLDADIALTEETHKVREETIQTQKVYINQRIYSMLERWEEVHKIDNTFLDFPKESIQKRDWENVAKEIKAIAEQENGIGTDLFQYIFLDSPLGERTAEELVEKAQQDNN